MRAQRDEADDHNCGASDSRNGHILNDDERTGQLVSGVTGGCKRRKGGVWMHEFITAVASTIILSLFVIQFALCENLLLEITACDKIITEYEQGINTEELDTIELKSRLEMVPNVKADVSEGRVDITIDNVVVPVWNQGDNFIKVSRELSYEEHDNYNSYSASDESAP